MGIFDVASENKTASGQTKAILNYIKQGKMTVFAELLTQVIMIIVMASWKQEPNQHHTDVLLLLHHSIHTIAHR